MLSAGSDARLRNSSFTTASFTSILLQRSVVRQKTRKRARERESLGKKIYTIDKNEKIREGLEGDVRSKRRRGDSGMARPLALIQNR